MHRHLHGPHRPRPHRPRPHRPRPHRPRPHRPRPGRPGRPASRRALRPRSRARRALLATAAALFAVGWLALFAAYVLDPVPLGTPVRGVRAFHSTFGAPRSSGRRHQGTDVFARRGTAVLAAHDGIVVHVGENALGGTVLYTLGRRGVLCYYAHLDAVAPAVGAGTLVSEGDVVGRVGNTGNARTTRPHLHFETRPLALGLRAVDPVSLLPGARRAALDEGARAAFSRPGR